MPDEEIYVEEIRCLNCGKRENHNIPKGMGVKRYKEHTKCSNCGCYLVYTD